MSIQVTPEMLRIPLSLNKSKKDLTIKQENLETVYMNTQYNTQSSMNGYEPPQFRITTAASMSPNKQDKGFIMKHKRLKALHQTTTQPFSSFKYSSLLTQQYENNEERAQSRQASRCYYDNSKFLTLEDELIHKDDDDLEVAAREVLPDDPRSIPTYNKVYKSIDRIQDKKGFYHQQNKTIYASMASLTGQQFNQSIDSYKLLPRKFGIIGSCGKLKTDQYLNVGHFAVGDRYAQVLGAGLASESMKGLKSVALQNNRLTAIGIEEVARSLPKRVNQLNLQGNKAGRVKKQEIGMLHNFNRVFMNIVDLNLENNKFYDEGAKIFFKELAGNKHIRKLNLSQNYISDHCCVELSDMLLTNKTLVELYLHWNWLHANSGKQIALALIQNDTLKILDLSHNSIGVNKTTKQQKGITVCNVLNYDTTPHRAWGDLLSHESSCLVHLDLSYNQFSVEDTKLVALKIENNHTLFGLHFRGNGDPTSYIDHLGYLLNGEGAILDKEILSNFIVQGQQSELQHEYVPGILKHRRINGTHALTKDDQQDENCWLCGGWNEVSIVWSPTALELHSDPMFVHFSHERYVPVQMTRIGENDNQNVGGSTPMSKKLYRVQYLWNVKRMIPSHVPIKFFFSSPTQRQSAFSRQDDQVEWSDVEKKKRVVFYTMEGQILKFRRPKRANILTTATSKPIFIDKLYQSPLVECQPRIKDIGGILKHINTEEEQDEEDAFNAEEDFFRDCPRDSDALFLKCFEFDWAKSSIKKIVKDYNEQARVKDYLKSIYKDIVTAYRQNSAYFPCGDIWSISFNCYTEFFSSILVESGKYGLKDMDIIYKQCTSRHNNVTRLQTQLALMRFQFMEIIVRLAIDKYYNNGTCNSIHEALQRLYEQDGLEHKIESVQDSQDWRDTMYWTPQCNKVATENSILLSQLYTLAVNLRQLNYFTTNKFVTPSAFRELMVRAKLIDEQNVERNINLGYTLSVQMVIDEVGSDRHMQMNFKEFTEALCRVSERMNNIVPVIEGDTKQDQLAFKFKSLIHLLAKRYDIQHADEKHKKSRDTKRDTPDLVRNSFVQQNANKLAFESEETPANAQLSTRFANLTSFSSAILNL